MYEFISYLVYKKERSKVTGKSGEVSGRKHGKRKT